MLEGIKDKPYWSIPAEQAIILAGSSENGLTGQEASSRLNTEGPNLLKPARSDSAVTLLVSQFKSPIILILLFAAAISSILHDSTDSVIILVIVIISGLLGFWQEKGAANAVKKLLSMVQVKADVIRDGAESEIPLEQIVPGDVILLRAGDIIPGDCLIIESRDLYVNEASLTGETYPVEKVHGVTDAEAPFAGRLNALWMGTNTVSGWAKALVVNTGVRTEFGKISDRLKLRPEETEFERGVRRFGYLLMEVTLILVIAIFAVNVFLKRPVLESLLFSMALAVGLTPQLLPAIISINLSHGARRMAGLKVIVKKLNSIENFGSMNILCSDKTGTLTRGRVRLEGAFDIHGGASEKVKRLAYLNAAFETGFNNPIDQAIKDIKGIDILKENKLDEIPYDFLRKRLSILVGDKSTYTMITKGAFANVIDACSNAEGDSGDIMDISSLRPEIDRRFAEYSAQGLRTLGIAVKEFSSARSISKADEKDMTFMGFIVFDDPPKEGVGDTVKELEKLGVALKIITGDNRLVAASVGIQTGLSATRILTGSDMHDMSDEALIRMSPSIDIFAEIEPNQKERIIHALKKSGSVVGYLGDGINDASALHTADVGISVDSAVDVAKEASDIVLLENDLKVLLQGVIEGRRTFANTLKYVFMATSANFGNMFSMAGASLILPFLPLLPKQILLTNLMTDFPEMTIATDSVDAELLEVPRRWNIGFIKKFMLVFGLLSSVFDYLTFGALLWILHASPEQFQTGWFMESVISAALIVLVIRSRRPFFKSPPGRYLAVATGIIAALALILPFTQLAALFGFKVLPVQFFVMLLMIVISYILCAELAKRVFYKMVNF